MESPELTLLFHGLDYSAQLAQRVCVVVVAAFACIRLQWVRRALHGAETSWRHSLTMIFAFGGLGIFATHSGILMNVEEHGVSVEDWSVGRLAVGLEAHQAMLGFRDTMVLAGGLIGGPWVGLGAGLISGAERYLLGGFAGLASGLGTVSLGLFAGWARWFRPHWAATPGGAFTVAFIGSLLHRLLILLLAKPFPLAIALTWEIMLPVLVVNSLGCVLFIWVMRDLDQDRLKNEVREALCREQEADLRTRQAEQREQEAHLLKQQAELRELEAQSLKEKAELRALRAQIKPHFLTNTLNGIRSLIRRDPALAREYVNKLADFFETTRCFACANTISLREEMEQLGRYLDLQQLRFQEKFHYQAIDIPADLLDCRLPPLSLLTLAENALDHGMRGCAEGFVLRVEAGGLGGDLALRVADNGCGIAPERLARLGKEPVESSQSTGNGVALHILARSLDLAFPGRARLAISSELGSGTEVVLTLPKER